MEDGDVENDIPMLQIILLFGTSHSFKRTIKFINVVVACTPTHKDFILKTELRSITLASE